jgi:hypothetical protein
LEEGEHRNQSTIFNSKGDSKMDNPLSGTSSDDKVAGVKGEFTVKGGGSGVEGVSTEGHGVRGTSVTNHGIHGESSTGRGVHGISKGFFGVSGFSDTSAGVFGESAQSIGVIGQSAKNMGVSGRSTEGFGVQGLSGSNHGVHGESNTGRGVHGISKGFFGVSGFSDTSAGVFGESAQSFGVIGQSAKNIGVVGTSTESFGVQGNSVKGVGVNGNSQSGDGVFAVSANGIGIHAKGGKLAGRFEGDVEVTGDIRLANADCAEDFDVFGAVKAEPGTVMVLGNEGALSESYQAYDKRVAGVISGAGNYKPGIVMDKQPTSGNRQPVALMGKVFCKVDAQFGAIEVGDLLTTSATPGHAMKTIDPLKAFGAVIGKALRPLADGQGLIPILIALQ